MNINTTINWLQKWSIKIIDKLTQKENHLRSILENAMDSIITINEDGIVTDYNPAAENLFGYTQAEVIGREISNFIIPPNLRQKHHEALNKWNISSNEYTFQRKVYLPGICKDGQIISLEVSLIVTSQGKKKFLTAFIRDNTSYQQLLQTLESTLQVAKSSNRIKSVFLSNINHEIRTPMNSIIGMIDLVLNTNLNHQQHNYIRIVQQSGQSLMELINHILDLSKIEAGQLSLEQTNFDLLGQIENVCESLALRAHEKNLEFNCHIADGCPPTLKGDPLRLRQVLLNLINNAIKFTEEGEVTVSVQPIQSLETDLCSVNFIIADTGIGIPSDMLGDVFESFTQADGSTTRKFGGTGLGLTISRSLVAMMGGEIEVNSEEGKGSVFSFMADFKRGCRFTSDDSNQQENSKNPPKEMPLKGVRVLTFVPNATTRDILRYNLKIFGTEVTEVCSEIDFKLHQESTSSDHPFDVLILDHQIMEDISWFQPERTKKVVLLVPTNGYSELQNIWSDDTEIIQIKTPIKRYTLLNAINWCLGKTSTQPPSSRAHLENLMQKCRPIRILLAEDMLNNQQVAIEILEQAGHLITLAQNGLEVLQHLEKASFDLILMDLQMPFMDGYETTREIRNGKIPTQTKIPIVAITAHAFKEDEKKTLDSDMNGYLRKPYRAIELLMAIHPFAQKLQPPKKNNGKRKKTQPILIPVPEDKTDIIESSKSFLANVPKLLKVLKAIVHSQKIHQSKLLIDKIKTAAENTGAARLRTSAIRLKSKFETDDMDAINSQLQNLESHINEALITLTERLDSHENTDR